MPARRTILLAEASMQCAGQVEGRIPLPSFHCLFGAKERPDPPRPGVPFVQSLPFDPARY